MPSAFGLNFFRDARSFCSAAVTSSYDFFSLSLHDALPICVYIGRALQGPLIAELLAEAREALIQAVNHIDGLLWGNLAGVIRASRDRKSTRLNSSHEWISYALFCLKQQCRRLLDLISFATHEAFVPLR